MNLGQLRTAIQARGYGTDTATAQTAAINSVIRKIHGMRRWPWLQGQDTITLTAGDNSFSITAETSDFMHIDALRVASTDQYYPLVPIDQQEWEDLSERNPATTGSPQYWSRFNDNVRIWSTPDASYTFTMDYIKVPTDLSGDSDTPLIPAAYQDVIVWGAIAEMAVRERDNATYDIAKSEYGARLGDMLNEYGTKQRQASDRVVQSGFHEQFDIQANPWLTY